jgi:hypothetical protein
VPEGLTAAQSPARIALVAALVTTRAAIHHPPNPKAKLIAAAVKELHRAALGAILHRRSGSPHAKLRGVAWW